jgi:hypothetical protein
MRKTHRVRRIPMATNESSFYQREGLRSTRPVEIAWRCGPRMHESRGTY